MPAAGTAQLGHDHGMNVFVSYQRADTLMAAHLLGYALKAAGHEGFVDTGSIAGGAPYREVIRDAVARSHLMVALIGPGFDVARLHEPGSVVAFEWQRARCHGGAVVPLLVDGARMPADAALPAPLRWFTRRNAYALRRETLVPDVERLLADLPALAGTPRPAARVLWVDDRPDRNENERALLREHGLVFDNVVSTREALAQLENERYDLVITDLGRAGSSDRSEHAGARLLALPVLREGGPPVVVYTSPMALGRSDELRAAGAAAVTAFPQALADAVLGLLGRGAPPSGELAR
jgi:CheY-like chemotaxis protein